LNRPPVLMAKVEIVVICAVFIEMMSLKRFLISKIAFK